MQLYIGCYTQPEHAASPRDDGGITSCRFDPSHGRLSFQAISPKILNPSYLALDPNNEFLLAVSENMVTQGAVHVFRRHTDGVLVPVMVQLSGGRSSCHVSLTPGGVVCVCSYGDRCAAFYSYRQGRITPCQYRHCYQAPQPVGPRKVSRPHQAVVSPDGRWLYVCDLGLDCIWHHMISDGNAGLATPVGIAAPENYGPRHMVFHPLRPQAYIICERNGHLLTYDWNSATGMLSLTDDIASLPADWKGQPAAAAIRIHPSQATLYVSNRNHNSLAVFALGAAGRARWVGCFSSGGKTPRDFAIDPSGRWLLCANQHSNHIAIHQLDPVTGLPANQPPEFFSTASPTCILFAM
jgi:6-phosphogluconolactonase